MRKELKIIFKNSFRKLAIKKRAELDISQEKMASALAMATRSYANIESGAGGCGALTLLLLLMSLPDPNAFLEELREEMETSIKEEEVLYK